MVDEGEYVVGKGGVVLGEEAHLARGALVNHACPQLSQREPREPTLEDVQGGVNPVPHTNPKTILGRENRVSQHGRPA